MGRLKSHIWVDALIRRASQAGAFVYVGQKGDPDAGTILIKVCPLDGTATLYTPEIRFDSSSSSPNIRGERVWRASCAQPEPEIQQRIMKRAQYDPDLWVIEIEDKEARHFLTEAILRDND